MRSERVMDTEEGPVKISVRETVDGRAVEEGADTGTARQSGKDGKGGAPRDGGGKSRRDKNGDEAHYRSDPWIWGIYVLLLVVSLVELYSASSAEVKIGHVYSPLIHHAIYLFIGFMLVCWMQRIHYRVYRRYAVLYFVVCILLLILSMQVGVNINGATRALSVKGFTIQPAELLKLAIVLILTRILSTHQMDGGVTLKGVFISVGVVALSCGLVFMNGLTNMALIMGVSLCMFIISGIQWSRIILAIVIYGVLGVVAWQVVYSEPKEDAFSQVSAEEVEQSKKEDIGRGTTRSNRIKRYIEGVNPEDSVTDENYQVIHANYAIAHGGLGGKGLGNSRESARLPLAFSDYIYSIIVEDSGFIGGVALLIVYLLLVACAGRVASKCSRAFPAILVMGCAVMIMLQALTHMAIVVGVGPVSGQPLPFISKGGTSIIVMSMAIGMMLSVSRYAARGNNAKATKRELKELPESMHSDNPMLITRDNPAGRRSERRRQE